MKHLENTMIASQPVSRNYEEPPTPAGPGRSVVPTNRRACDHAHLSLPQRERQRECAGKGRFPASLHLGKLDVTLGLAQKMC